MKLGGILALAAALILTGCAQTPPPVSDKVAQYYSNPPTAAAVKTPAALAPTVALLNNQQRPWTLSVVGDSTGAGSERWPHLLAVSMSAKYGRPVILHNWSTDTNAYGAPETVGAGQGQPIVIWNGSASGKNAAYSLANWAAMAPERPDLLIVNHGHNQGSAQEATSGAYDIVDRATNQWPNPPAVAVTLQNPTTDQNAARQESIVAGLRTEWTGKPVTLIDAMQAFKAAPNLGSLLNADGLHPDAAGSVVWVEAVKHALGV
jgi:microcompartment protein CcmK/EutM